MDLFTYMSVERAKSKQDSREIFRPLREHALSRQTVTLRPYEASDLGSLYPLELQAWSLRYQEVRI